MSQQADPVQHAAPQPSFSVYMAVAAGLCWAGVLALLQLGNLQAELPLAPQRLLFYTLGLLACLLTFAPIEAKLGLPGLTVEGLLGCGLLLYCLAFVPAPNEWLLFLPDTPVYVLLIGALFMAVAALAMPFVYALGKRMFSQRARALDLRRVRRQAHEIGFVVAAIATLAGLRVLTWVSLLLLGLIVVIAELLFLSRVTAVKDER